jgi:RNA-directed DNA polymerase
MPERATVMNRSKESAEAIVVAGRGRRAERVGEFDTMSTGNARHQKPAQAGRSEAAHGEPGRDSGSDEAQPSRHDLKDSGQGLLARALGRENLQRAWKRVKANKGAPGVDGLDIEQTGQLLKTAWPTIRAELLAGRYKPSPVRRVMIGKPDGGERELGIPTVIDRLIQQALLQVLQPLIDPTFSKHSYGFRPGRRAHDAVLAAQAFVQSGRRIVVDVDLEKFFDRVNHDILIDRLRKRIGDAEVIRLIRAYLNSGIMGDVVVQQRYQGMPQGGPLSPLLANVLLDEVDRELERRGHGFARYADDCNVYVRSQKAGERVMALLRGLYARLHLTVNEAKSAVGPAFGRKFLGFSLRADPKGEVKRSVSIKARNAFKQRVRQLTRRSGGRSMGQVIERLRPFLLGWKAYFGLAQHVTLMRELDGWMRHRLRAIQLKQWRRGSTIYRELVALGASPAVAQKVAGNSRCWWRNSRLSLNGVLTIAWFDRLGMVRLS